MTDSAATCDRCGAALAPGRFCEQCGQPVRPRFCEQCGAGLAPGVSFCEECGSPVAAAPPQPRAVTPNVVPVTGLQPAAVPVQPRAASKPKRKARMGWVLLLLAVLAVAAAGAALWAWGVLNGGPRQVIVVATETPTPIVQIVVVTPVPPTETAPAALDPATAGQAAGVAPAVSSSKGVGLLIDGLNDNHLGWPEGESPELGTRYWFEDGRYHMGLAVSGLQAVSVPSPDRPDLWRFGDLILEADARLVEGPGGQAYGLVFRYQDGDNYALCEISGQGSFRCAQVVQGSRIPLIDWTDHPAIRPGIEANRLGVTAQGSQVWFYVNGEQVGSFSAAGPTEGKVGLSLAAYADGPASAAFSNLGVWSIGP